MQKRQKRKSRSKRPKYKSSANNNDNSSDEGENTEFKGHIETDESNSFSFESFKEPLKEHDDDETVVERMADNRKCFFCEKQASDLRRCTQCKVAEYCDRQCQKAHWPQHKLDCRGNKSMGATSTSGADSEHNKKYDADASTGSRDKSDVNSGFPNSKRNNVSAGKTEDKTGKSIFNVVHSRPLSEQVPCFYCKRHREDLKKCVKCKIAVYCDRECQKAHWPVHKSACRNLSDQNSSENSRGNVMEAYDCLANPESRGGLNDDGVDGSKSAVLRPCLSCDTLRSDLITCSKCHVAEYCDRACEARHHEEHRPGCDNYPKFHKALAKSSRVLAEVHGCHSTEMVFPPLPHPFFASFQPKSENALLLEIVGPYQHFLRHGVYVQDVNGNEVHMLFYHEKSEELSLEGSMSRLLAKGNFMRWFYPRWRFFTDGTTGFRIDSLKEIEFIQKSWEFDFSSF